MRLGAGEALEELGEVHARGGTEELHALRDVVGDRTGELARPVGGDDGQLVDGGQRLGGLADDLREHRDQHLQDRGVPVPLEGLGLAVHRLGLGGAPRQDRRGLRVTLQLDRLRDRRTPGPLGLTALGALDGLRLGQGGAALLLSLTGEPGPLGLRLRGGDGGGALGLGLLDPGHALGLRLLLGLVAAGVGGLADLGVELAVGQRRLALGDLLLLGEDLLLAVGVGQRSGGVRLGRGGVGLGLDLGLAQVQGALRDRDLLLGLEPGLRGGAPGVGLRDVGLLLRAGGLGAAEVLQVGALGGDVLDLERVEHQALAGEAGLGLLGDLPGEGGPVADDVLHRHAADDGAQGTGEHFLGEADDAVLLLEEALGGRADGVLCAADLDDRDAFQIGLDAAQGDGPADRHRDVTAGQVQGEALLHEGDDEDPAADHDLLAAVVGDDLSGRRVRGLLAAASRDDERLAGTGDLVAGDDGQCEQDEEDDHPHDCGEDRAHDNSRGAEGKRKRGVVSGRRGGP